jgi:FkbH-like protein
MSAKSAPFRDLPWLPRLSPDFRDRLRALVAQPGSDWDLQLRQLAGQAFGVNQAIALAGALDRLRGTGAKPRSLVPFRLGLVSDSTTDFVKPLLIASALRYGIALEVIVANFGQLMQEAIDPSSLINASKPDAILIARDPRALPLRASGGTDWPPYDASAAIAEIAELRAGFRRNCGATCLVQTIPAPASLLFGSFDAATAGTLRGAIANLNARLQQDVPRDGDVLIDVEWLAQRVGLEEWYDERHWYLSRLGCAQQMLPIYADFVVRTIAALRGKSRKCLVLDLDNTLWGGVIGDDGLEGIALDAGDAKGEAFRAVQTAAADLRRRGIVLAVCSKNEDATARLPFRSHPGMVLKETDIAVFLANWEDKATNLERIARTLDIGLDALVLLDDNPAEREQVRQALPEVAVPELGADPTAYASTLLAAGYFESVAFTNEDLARAEQYRSNADRAQALEGARSLDDFLRSLQMEIHFAPFRLDNRKRITQLINKTNQFNVTTRRYTEQQVAALEGSSEHFTLQVSLRDKFGDNGMIAVVICAKRGAEWDIDSWLMSCRVLNRRVEQAICNRLVAEARRAGATKLIGSYIPTERNGLVRDLFRSLGFVADEAGVTAAGGTRWLLDVERFEPLEVFFAEGAAPAAEPATA